jgi:hypothetical protein
MSSACAAGGLVVFSSYGEGQLVVNLCAGTSLPAQAIRQFAFTLKNPGTSQDATTDVRIAMTSTRFSMSEKVMARPGTKQDGVVHFTDPPLVVVAAIVVHHIEQVFSISPKPGTQTPKP